MPEYIPGYYLPHEPRPIRLTAEDVQRPTADDIRRIASEASTALRTGTSKTPDPDPCCVHEAQLDTAVRDLARAHGRPEAAERIARGLPVKSADPATSGTLSLGPTSLER